MHIICNFKCIKWLLFWVAYKHREGDFLVDRSVRTGASLNCRAISATGMLTPVIIPTLLLFLLKTSGQLPITLRTRYSLTSWIHRTQEQQSMVKMVK